MSDERQRAIIVNDAADTDDIYEAVSQRITMARGFCISVANDKAINGIAETGGVSESAWGHSELLEQAKELLNTYRDRINKGERK
jgi:hypothetical protein